MELHHFIGLRIDYANASRPALPGIVDELVDDRVRPQREVPGRITGGKSRNIAAEIRAVGATTDTAVAELAGAPPEMRLGQIRGAADGHHPPFKTTGDLFPHVEFEAVHLHRRQKLP